MSSVNVDNLSRANPIINNRSLISIKTHYLNVSCVLIDA